ncbi:MAG: hypothetical protein IT285_04665 [Bdellovibrionales bacterium]|nr:hypothetical protein [Bdellovibrionales bacterium]
MRNLRHAWIVSLAAMACAALAPEPAQGEIHHMFRGGRVQAMGGAGIAVADDPATGFWLNPALVGAAEDTRLNYAVADVELAGNLITDGPAVLGIATDFSPSTLNQLLGRNVFGRAQVSPTFVAPGFGAGLLLDGQSALYAKNSALPQVTLGQQTTMGAQAAVALPLQRRRGRRSSGESYLGAAVKVMWRRGGYYRLPTAELIAASQNGQAGLNGIIGNFEFALGADVGVFHRRRVSRKFSWSVASSLVDAGNTHFGGLATDAESNWTVGAAGEYDMGSAKLTVAYDFSNITQDEDWKLKNHIGAELRFPVLRLYAGVHQVYLTYGVGLNLWLLDFVAQSYAEELSTSAFQEPNRRFMVRLGMNLMF